MITLLRPTLSVADSIDQALRYDEFQERMHGREYATMRNAIVESIPSGNHAPRILDCGTGTADLVIRLAARHPSATFTAIDSSENYLKVASDRARMAGLAERVTFLQRDLRAGLAVELGTFDVAVSQYVFHYRFDRAALFSALADRLVTGGTLIFGVSPRSADEATNRAWFEKKEANALSWFLQRGVQQDRARLLARADRLYLEKYAIEHCVSEPIEDWLVQLATAGFTEPTIVWRSDLDVVVRARK